MQLQHECSQDVYIQELQQQIAELTTENVSLKDQLAQKEQYIAMIAHELRGPLSPIINYAQMVARHVCKAESVMNVAPPPEIVPPVPMEEQGQSVKRKRDTSIQRSTGIIVGQARRLTRLVNDLLDASRLTSGQFTLIRENCDLTSLMKETTEQLRPVAPYHTLICDVPDNTVMGNWDGMRLQQAIGNLLDNAIKYSDERTIITARAWITPGVAHVSIHNQGTSIPSADISSLFRPYTRFSTTHGRRGSGLGLYITKSIIDAHGGNLRLEPHTEDESNQGTTFAFELPM